MNFRLFAEKHPKFSVFEIYQKLHDTILLNVSSNFQPTDKDPRRLNTIFEKLLKEFHETVIYNPKEYILIREHTRNEKFQQHFSLRENPFNEPIIPVLHNIIIDCGYISNGLIINYSAFEEEIPLSAKNIILKDPRMELKSEPLADYQEVVHLDESVSGMFSPDRSDTSPSNSPEYTASNSSASPQSDANSDIIEVTPIHIPSETPSGPPSDIPSDTPLDTPLELPIQTPSVAPPETLKKSPKAANSGVPAAKAVAPKNIIKLSSNPKSKYNEEELKKIVRRVVVSSDESDSE